jgi:hypothetical protein
MHVTDVQHEGPVPDVRDAGGRPRRRVRAVVRGRLYDQLRIAQILARLADLRVRAERITLICIEVGDAGVLAARSRPSTAARSRVEGCSRLRREARPYLGDTWSFATMDRLARAGLLLAAKHAGPDRCALTFTACRPPGC